MGSESTLRGLRKPSLVLVLTMTCAGCGSADGSPIFTSPSRSISSGGAAGAMGEGAAAETGGAETQPPVGYAGTGGAGTGGAPQLASGGTEPEPAADAGREAGTGGAPPSAGAGTDAGDIFDSGATETGVVSSGGSGGFPVGGPITAECSACVDELCAVRTQDCLEDAVCLAYFQCFTTCASPCSDCFFRSMPAKANEVFKCAAEECPGLCPTAR